MESAPNPFLSTGPKYTGPPMISCIYSGRTTYEQRLSTYPASWYTNTRCPDPAIMAQAGLFRISSPDRMYLAGCSECDFGTAQWDKDPFVLHVKNSPNCPLILRARKEHQASQAIAQSAQSSTSSANQRSAQVAMQPAPQVAPQAIIESCTQLATPSIAELEAQAIIESYTQLATQRRNSSMTQKTTLQASPITAYEEVLRVAIATPLPQAVECRRCLAEFSSNSKLHRHVRESHGKKIPRPATSKAAMPVAEHSASESAVPQKSGAPRLVDSEIDQAAPDTTATAALRKFAMPTIYSVTKSIAPANCSVLTLTPAESTFRVIASSSARSTRSMTAASASKSQLPPKRSASSLLSSETTSSPPTTSRAATSRPTCPRSATPPPIYRSTSPPPTYRTISPPPPAYQPKKNYLTVADLYKRYEPLKSTCPAQKTTASRAYLTVQDLYEKFGNEPHSDTVEWASGSSANRVRASDNKQSQIASQGSSESMRRNADKALPSVTKSPATGSDRIGFSAVKSACDSKSSSIDFFRDFKSFGTRLFHHGKSESSATCYSTTTSNDTFHLGLPSSYIS